LLAPLLSGPARRGTVILSSPAAAYAQVGRDVFALLRPGATSLPCAVLLPRTGAVDLPAAGARITVGDGIVAWPDRRCAVTRWWLPARVRSSRLDPDRVVAFATAVCGPMLLPVSAITALDRHRIGEVVDRLLRGEVEDAAELALGVLGHGPGSTPAADDALAGALLALRGAGTFDDEDLTRLDRLLAPATEVTTALSAALLRHAAAGWAADAVVRAVAAVQVSGTTVGDDRRPVGPNPAGGPIDPVTAARTLLRLGHTSGADTAVGIVVAATAVGQCEHRALDPVSDEVA
jgi:hypothetical protein